MKKTIEIVIGAAIAVIAMAILLSFIVSFLQGERTNSIIKRPLAKSTPSGVAVSWETSELANEILFYTIGDSVEEKKIVNSEFKEAHRITIEAGAKKIRIQSCDSVGRCSEYEFN